MRHRHEELTKKNLEDNMKTSCNLGDFVSSWRSFFLLRNMSYKVRKLNFPLNQFFY